MAGPLVFWPNRKSALGLRLLSNVARRTHAAQRAWFTTPPIAEDTMREAEFDINDVNAWILKERDKHQRIRMVLERLDPELLKHFDGIELERKELVARNRVVEEAKEQLEALRPELEQTNANIRAMRRDLEVVVDDNEKKTADLRRLRKEIDPDEIKLRIMYAVDEAMVEKVKELAAARATIADQTSRIAELERGKKRLREALDRLSRAT